jgi:hemerythrin-like domain-containing protein
MLMKRHPALQSLSRDHLPALIQAQQIRRSVQGEKGAPPLEEVAKGFLRFWEAEASPHFREEEEVLLPIYARLVPPSQDENVLQMLDDHAWFRDVVFELQRKVNASEDLRGFLGQVGQRLDDHVRLEERLIFEHMQGVMGEKDLADVEERSRAFREKWRAPIGDDDNPILFEKLSKRDIIN